MKKILGLSIISLFNFATGMDTGQSPQTPKHPQLQVISEPDEKNWKNQHKTDLNKHLPENTKDCDQVDRMHALAMFYAELDKQNKSLTKPRENGSTKPAQ